jgi:hypothetical protein
MQAPLRALLTDIVDYAGLFPPARLDLPGALANFLAYRLCPDAWMLGRFICPAAQLGGVVELRQQIGDHPLRLSVLGRGGQDVSAFMVGWAADRAALEEAQRSLGPLLRVEAFEMRLPPVDQSGDAIRDVLRRVESDLAGSPWAHVARFFEPTLGTGWRETVAALAHAVADHNLRHPRSSGVAGVCGFKLRTGGLDAAAFPSSEQIAFVIQQCRDARIPLKFTAGLHHPIRRFDPGVRAHMHGFVNVFGAAVLAYAVALDLHDIQGVIDEQDARHFHFDSDHFAWNDAEAAIDEIAFTRRMLAISFGSCSFDEPRDDLRALGWLK